MTGDRYLLDTNIISALLRHPPDRLLARIAAVEAGALAVSVVAVGELHFGSAKRQSVRLAQQIDAILAALEILPLTSPVAVEYGAIRAGLEASGRPIGPNDIWLAAHARALDAILVTANVREFSRVSGLKIENWLA